jgi:hypothetical protein
VSGGAQVLLHQLLGLCGILVAACEAAQGAQQSLRHNAFNEVTQAEAAGPGWLAGEGPRAAWSELAEVRGAWTWLAVACDTALCVTVDWVCLVNCGVIQYTCTPRCVLSTVASYRVPDLDPEIRHLA